MGVLLERILSPNETESKIQTTSRRSKVPVYALLLSVISHVPLKESEKQKASAFFSSPRNEPRESAPEGKRAREAWRR